MTSQRATVGMCFDRSFDASLVTTFARALDGKVDHLWVIEDCFYTTGTSLAAAALAVTEELTVGLGILPARARTAAVTAMEIATLCGLAPGRVIGGIGHGVQSWMAQMGVLSASPLTALEEVVTTVGRLLDGETVTFDGRYVILDEVRLDHPPRPKPKILAGVRRPRSMELAGRWADGVVLSDSVGPHFVPTARNQAGDPDDFEVVVFAPLITAPTRKEAYEFATPWLAAQLASPTPSLSSAPFFQDLLDLHRDGGDTALRNVPAEWWAELGAIGTRDDAAAHIAALDQAGATGVALFPAPVAEVAVAQIDDVVELANRG